MATIAIVTDQPVLRAGFEALLASTPHRLLLPEAVDPAGAAREVERMRPEVVLLDWNPRWTLRALSDFCAGAPETRVILTSRDPSPELVYQVQEAGLSGLLDTRCSQSEILALLERGENEEFAFDAPEGTPLRRATAVHMTPREGQLVCLLAQGLKNKEIATYLGISEGTVKVYLSKLFQKTGAKDRFEMALFALKNMAALSPGTGEASDDATGTGPRELAGPSTLVLSEGAPGAEGGSSAEHVHGHFAPLDMLSRRGGVPGELYRYRTPARSRRITVCR